MFCKLLLAISFGLVVVSASAQQSLELDYQYGGAHGVDFSSMPRGPLKLASFSDGRTGADPRHLDADFIAPQPVAELVRSALLQGFAAGDAQLVEDGEALVLSGEVTEVAAASKGEDYEMTIKAKVQLRSASGNQLFSTSIFGRGAAPQSAGMEAALTESLDQLVNSLLWDDYFLMQVID